MANSEMFLLPIFVAWRFAYHHRNEVGAVNEPAARAASTDLWAAFGGMVLLKYWAGKVVWRQPDYPEFDGSQWHWNSRPLRWELPPRVQYGPPIQLERST